jgi:hypothetical protein
MKNIEWQDDRDIYGRMLLLTDSYLFTGLRNAVDNYDADLTDALTWGQLKSKRWLISELEKFDNELGTIFMCAGWYSVLGAMLFESNCRFDKIRSFDIDDSCAVIADTINRKYVLDGWKFKASTLDIHKLTYPITYVTKKFSGDEQELTEEPDTIINTSCEHIINFDKWYRNIPNYTLVILQSNDYTGIDEHVNCVSSIEQFKNQTPMSKEIFTGEMKLEKYTRFMRLGYK